MKVNFCNLGLVHQNWRVKWFVIIPREKDKQILLPLIIFQRSLLK